MKFSIKNQINSPPYWGCWVVGLWLFCVCAAYAQGVGANRVGVLFPDAQQRQAAVKAAPKGQDIPLSTKPVLTPDKVNTESSEADTSSVLQEKAKEALSPVTLDERIQNQTLLKNDLKQFGYDWFSSTSSSFSSVDTTPVPADYEIKPGDTFVVQVFGATDVEYRLVVTREGRLLIPEIGDLHVIGLTFKEAKLAIQQNIDKVRIGVKTVVTLAEVQSIQIIVMGEFERPGTYTVSGLSTLFNALFVTGGIKKTGSLRNIQVRRQNGLIAKMDFYEVLLKGQSNTSHVYLRHGDTIFVPTIGPTVGIAGEVNRPAIYELKNERTVTDVIALAGGLLPTAAQDKPQIRRVGSNGYTLLQANLNKGGGHLKVISGDVIRVFPVPSKIDDVVVLSGNVSFPGGYQWQSGMKITDLVGSMDSLRLRTEFDVAVLVREKRFSKRIEVMYVNLGKALENPNSVHNLELKARDELIVFETNSPRDNLLADTVRQIQAQATVAEPAMAMELKGYVLNPGVYPIESGMRFLDAIRVSGGLQVGTDTQYSLIARRSLHGRLELIHLKVAAALSNLTSDDNPLVLPGDRIYLFDDQINRTELLRGEMDVLKKQARYGEPVRIVQISGKVSRPGTYPLTPDMRVQDLIVAAGGLKEEAYGQTASLSRRTELLNEQNQQDHIEINLSSMDVRLPNSSIALMPSDHLVIREKPDHMDAPRFVVVEGEVRFQGTYPIDKRETLCQVVRRAGGFTNSAYVFGTIFTRESVRIKEQAAINKIFDQMDTLLAEVHTSSAYDNDKKLPVNNNANEIYNVIKGLKPPKAEGRMVIDAQLAVEKCNEETDVVLESGDKIVVPKMTDEVSVVGQVYHPTSHKYKPDRAALDYINLSGGTKELASREHAFVIQANGEVVSVRSSMSRWTWLMSPLNVKVTPGAMVVVPMSVDRINDRELFQSWIDTLYKATVSLASLAFLFK